MRRLRVVRLVSVMDVTAREDWTRIAEPTGTPEIGSTGSRPALSEHAGHGGVKACDGGHDALIDPICQDS